jgi:hypothetical protein
LTPRVKTEVLFALQIALAERTAHNADEYWRDWLWHRRATHRSPDMDACDRLAEEYGVSCRSVRAMWRRWEALLTSLEYFEALTGFDARSLSTAEGGKSHRRA